ncbi:hypothetical protein FisN_19Hh151 [Fistulifera solaris]|uniref:Sulfotransferase domain-containing protein n=1 Tax=Fistulifera solaris TaxID=1519565 RepID=A0A1Z5JZV5_FISSO|nr:hypothetical protein FisN_19Hh151 [Fistulifera solaris]|eukprot:GAX19573.1 hypothetical protein FisN_19Hh151 [Fistulifera solaris]
MKNQAERSSLVAGRFWLYCFAITITVAMFTGHYLLSNYRLQPVGILLEDSTAEEAPVVVEEAPEAALPEDAEVAIATPPAKPLLVLHVGPGKTATTTLQVDLTRPSYEACLAEDDYLYGGRFYLKPSQNSDGKWMEGPESFSPPLETLRDILIPAKARNTVSECSPTRPKCWKALQQQIDDSAGDHHIILSDEPLALRWTPENAKLMKDAFRDVRDILVVIGYRRFFDWLPSSIFQRNRKRLVDKHWPSRGELAMLDPLWPLLGTSAEAWKERHYTFTDSLVQATQAASLPHRILNMHDPTMTVSSQFFCQVLPSASSCCQLAANATSSTIMNMRTEEQVHQLYFDTITTAAAAKGWIHKSKYSRPQIREALKEYYHARPLKQWSLYCPTEQQLQLLYDQSWRMEQELIIGPTVDPEFRYHLEEEHRSSFEGRVREGAFCQLDLKASLETFRDFFRKYSK